MAKKSDITKKEKYVFCSVVGILLLFVYMQFFVVSVQNSIFWYGAEAGIIVLLAFVISRWKHL
ncbi:MAG: hypothetical protein J4473_04635 [Candidatus Aenigmarchaeota archaeon]|nr:hypothetical protein [Candidatus Aenigmarchaeota archaeon]